MAIIGWEAVRKASAEADKLEVAKLHRAKDFVRDVLHLMGQPEDANNPELVARVAHQVLGAMP